MRRRLFALAVLLLLLPSTAGAERLPIRAYTTADGLAHNTVHRIVRDSRGFLWFATDDGLSRFDGYTFTNYSVEQGLPHRQVRDLLETRGGEFWVATSGGLVRFRPDGVPLGRVVREGAAQDVTPMFATIVPADEDPRARALLKLLESADGTLWCGTQKGLFRLDRAGGGFELRQVAVGMLEDYPEQKFVKDLLEDEHKSLWMATPSGLYRRWPDGTAARYRARDLLGHQRPGGLHPSYNHLHTLMKDRRGRIWVGARGLGFFRLQADGSRGVPSIVEVHEYPAPFASWIEDLHETPDGRFWATSNYGLIERLPHDGPGGLGLLVYDRIHGLSERHVTALGTDVSGNLWIATSGTGVMKLARSGLVTYGSADGVVMVSDVFEDPTGARYIRAAVIKPGPPPGEMTRVGDEHLETSFGRFDGRRFEWFKPGPPFDWGSAGARCILRTRNGEYWLGSGNGLMRYAPLPTFDAIQTAKPVKVFDMSDGLPDLTVYRLFEDARGDVWFSIITGTNGLFRWSRATNTLQNMAVVPGFPPIEDELPRAFREDGAGNVWIGLNNGVARFRNDAFVFFKTANGRPIGRIVDIHLDAARRLWLASSDSGLIGVDDPSADAPSFRRYTMADGLSSDSLEVMTEDLQGRLYLVTSRGIDQFDPVTGAVRTFTTDDGLGAGRTMTAYRDGTGTLWFGTFTGLSRFTPDAPAPSAAPVILITGLTVAGRPRPVSAVGETSVVLPDLRPGGNQLQIDFASLRFGTGERVRYQYRLEGSDREWGPVGDRRSVTYASLSPGSYRFLVRAVNADGVASPQPAVIAFTVLPPVWLRWWFLSLAVLAVASAALAFHRYRLARSLELERVRTRIATDLHDDVGANLTRIAILSEVARRQPPAGGTAQEGPLTSIADIARESVATMSDIVWAITPERDTLRDMVRRMRDHAEEVFETRDIRVIFDMPDLAQATRLGVDIRRDLYLVFKEAVNNAARHSACSTVAIALGVERGELRLEVTDDGVGFDPEAGADGNGLGSMRARAARLGASIDLLSARGAGTTVRLKMPLREARTSATTPTPSGR